MRVTNSPADTVHDDRQLPALTGLRFFAAATVLVSHFAYRGLVDVPQPILHFVDGGRTSVALFFVLSGFILTYNYEHLAGRRDRLVFYINRTARIYPVVLLSLAIGAAGVVLAALDTSTGWLLDWYALKSVDPVALTVSFVSQLTMTTGWFPTARINQPWNSPAWSIACEMFFYLLFPFLIVWMRKHGPRVISAALVALFAAQVVLIIGARTFAAESQRGFLVSQFPPTHLFDFAVGIAAALVFLRGGRAWISHGNRRATLLFGSLLLIVAISWARPVDPAYLLLNPLFAVMVFALASPPRRRASILAQPALLTLGEASFSLYMIHVPLMNLYSVLAPPVWAGWLLATATVGMSILIFKQYETPARRLVKRVLTPAILGRTSARESQN
jgi:peptidoglycan/LPS O-acetylase OafA/YrhL